jgi:hypothetical protein
MHLMTLAFPHSALPAPILAAQVADIVKEVFQKEPSRGVNPDEVVALGAAIQVCSPPAHPLRGHPAITPFVVACCPAWLGWGPTIS